MPVSKNKIKYIRSLELKKNRKSDKVFIAEGPKLVSELLPFFECRYIAASEYWISSHPEVLAHEMDIASVDELQRMSLLKSPQDVIAIFAERTESIPFDLPSTQLCLALDGVQDPGNLGTIIRIADWFGINHIYCSPETADMYNPKVVQATMGSLARVHVHYLPLVPFIEELDPSIPIYGTLLDGENIYEKDLMQTGIIVMGNEGNGISKEMRELITHKLYIPTYPQDSDCAESLNVAIATAITCAEFRRRVN